MLFLYGEYQAKKKWNGVVPMECFLWEETKQWLGTEIKRLNRMFQRSEEAINTALFTLQRNSVLIKLKDISKIKSSFSTVFN